MHDALNDHFDEILELVEPFFAPESRWGTSSTLDHLAYRALRERYPRLSADHIHVLLTAARQVLLQRGWD